MTSMSDQNSDMERLLRAAISEHREAVMTITDTEEELRRFQGSLRESHHRRRTIVAVAASAAVVAAGVGYAVVASVDGSDGRTTVAAPRDLRDAETLGTTTLPGGAGSLDVVGGQVLVATGSALTSVDPATGEVVRQVPSEGGELGSPVVRAGDALWASYFRDETELYARIDPDAGRITTTADVGQSYWLASGGAGLWAVAAGEDIVRLDPATGAELSRVTLPFRPFGLWVTDDAVWAQAASGGRLARVDAASGSITPGPTLSGSAHGALVGEELWVVEPTSAQLVRLDGRDGAEIARIALPGVAPGDERESGFIVAEDGASVYVSTAQDNERLLVRIDIDSGDVRDAVRLTKGPRPFFVDGSGDAVWLAAPGGTELLRLAPPTR